jgi:hypothetical protein
MFLSSITLPRLLPNFTYIRVKRRVSYKKQELLTVREHLSSPCFGFFLGVRVAHLFIFVCVVLLCDFTFSVPSCDVRYNIRIKKMFGSS